MADLIFMWLRGFLYTVAVAIGCAVAIGALNLFILFPQYGVPIVVLILLPLAFGYITEE